MAGKRRYEQDRSDSDNGKDGNESVGRRQRVTRSLGMPENEWAARERRRTNFEAQKGFKSEGQRETEEPRTDVPEQVAEQTESAAEFDTPKSQRFSPATVANNRERKPWESLIIGRLGENLSYIEHKNREIERQRYIVEYYEENSPHQVEHNRRILDRLIEEREQMEDNEENHIPE